MSLQAAGGVETNRTGDEGMKGDEGDGSNKR